MTYKINLNTLFGLETCGNSIHSVTLHLKFSKYLIFEHSSDPYRKGGSMHVITW